MARRRAEMSEATRALGKVIKRLTDREAKAAIVAAKEHLKGELSARYRVFPPELRIEKPTRPRAAPRRTTAVLVVDYEKRRTWEVLVDANLKAARVADLTGFQPAFLGEEVKEARKTAEQDARVLRATRTRGMFVHAFGPHRHGKPGARVIGLRYAARDARRGFRLLGEAVVDLSRRRLVDFTDLRKER